MTSTGASRPAARTPVLDRRRAPVGLPLGLVLVAAGLVAVALLGPLATGVVDYRVTETLRNQTIGLDAVSLGLVAPLALAAAVLVRRGRVAGFALALGIGAYTTYMFLQYVLGPDYSALRGNNERLFPLALALFTGGWAVALAAWHALPDGRIPGSRTRDRRIGIALAVLGVLTFVRYVPALADWLSGYPADDVYLAGPSFAWAIALLDLGVLLPVTAAACLGLLTGSSWARRAAALATGWLGLIGPAVAAMAVTMYANDDPAISRASAVVMTVLGLAFLALAVAFFQPLLRERTRLAA